VCAGFVCPHELCPFLLAELHGAFVSQSDAIGFEISTSFRDSDFGWIASGACGAGPPPCLAQPRKPVT
jgi:hypothetical protein